MSSGRIVDEAVARAAWSRLIEPGDAVAGALLATWGAVESLAWLRQVAAGDHAVGPRLWGGAALPPAQAGRLARSAARWAARLEHLDPRRELRVLERLGGTLLVPGAPGWPAALDDLGFAAPPCLWVRGSGDLEHLLGTAVAVIGARACTAYGEHVAADLAAGIASRGRTVVSGGAYGIDAVAHRAALAVDGPTVAFLACGVDRFYPAGNSRLLEGVVGSGGAVVSEVPPGSVPTRSRFLQRNRLIAAGSRATVVVEAAWRSGALSTAARAAALLRPVGAVPGPITSAASAGCHRLLRDGAAVCVTDVAEVLELCGRVGDHLPAEPSVPVSPQDGLSDEVRRTLDALPVRRLASPESVARAAGLTVAEVRAALGTLELAGLAVGGAAGWRRGNT